MVIYDDEFIPENIKILKQEYLKKQNNLNNLIQETEKTQKELLVLQGRIESMNFLYKRGAMGDTIEKAKEGKK